MQKIQSRHNQRGVTLLEIIFVIAIAGAIALVVIGNFATGQAQQRIQQEVSNLNTLTTLVRSTFSGQGTYEGLENSVMTGSSTFPDSMRAANDDHIAHSWADDGIELSSTAIDGADHAGFTITYKAGSGIQSGICADLANSVFQSFLETEIDSTEVNNVGEISTACDDNVEIVFTAR